MVFAEPFSPADLRRNPGEPGFGMQINCFVSFWMLRPSMNPIHFERFETYKMASRMAAKRNTTFYKVFYIFRAELCIGIVFINKIWS